MRVRMLTPVLAFSILLISGCVEEKPALVMPVYTDSDLAQVYYKAGLEAYDQLKFSLAHENFEYAVKEDPDLFIAYFWMFFISSKDSRTGLDKALQTDVQNNPGEEELKSALKYMMDGQNEKVVEQLNKAIDLFPSDPHLYKILYIIQAHYFKEYEAAITTIERALLKCPEFPLAFNQLGYAYLALEQFEKAEEAFDKYIDLVPELANPYDSKGDYYMATEQYEKAYESYLRAFELDSDFVMSKQKAKKAEMLQEKKDP